MSILKRTDNNPGRLCYFKVHLKIQIEIYFILLRKQAVICNCRKNKKIQIEMFSFNHRGSKLSLFPKYERVFFN